MKLFIPPDIDQYAHQHTQSRAPLFDELHDITHAEVPLPQMQVGRVEGGLLKLLATLLQAERILEIGTFTGYSALCMAEALPDNGELLSCDIDPKAVEIARSFFDRSPHGSKITVALGDALDTVRAIEGTRPLFDMVFLDADKARYPDYYEAILPQLRPGGLFVVDNTLWSGEVLDPQTPDAHGIAKLNERIQRDDRVENVMLTVRDGMMLARKL